MVHATDTLARGFALCQARRVIEKPATCGAGSLWHSLFVLGESACTERVQ